MQFKSYYLPLLALGLLLGSTSALYLSWWPSAETLVLIALAGLVLLLRQRVFAAAWLAGYVWLLVFLAGQMQQATPTNLPASHTTQVSAQITQTLPNAVYLGKTRLSWYPETATPQQGEVWQLEARLRPLRSLYNYGQPDFSAVSLARGQVQAGYVTQTAAITKLQAASRIDKWRNQLINQVANQPLAEQPGWRFMLALGLGAQNLMTPQDWLHLQYTGTLHLWIVSGLHLGLLAGLVLGIGRRFAWPQYVVFPLAAGLALGYAHLAGWGVAAERAALMLLLGLLVLSGWRQLGAWVAFSLALIVLLLLNPLIILSKGFWLSFGAVAVLITGFYGRTLRSSGWYNLIKVQLLLLLAFTPILVWQGAWFNLWSLPINLILVPLVGLLLLPATLVALALNWLDVWWPLHVLASAFNCIAWGLEWAVEFSQNSTAWWAQFNQHYLSKPNYLWLGLLALLPVGLPLRHLAWLGLVLALWPVPNVQNLPGNWQVKFLDVGQGTAVLVESQGVKMLYDTGRRYPSGWAPVVAALQPWLDTQGLDQLVLSHDDDDHSGGFISVQEIWPIQQEFSARKRNCFAGQSWHLGELEVISLWPPAAPEPNTRADNKDSCVLLLKAPEVDGKFNSLLLTGDAGLAEEAYFSQALAYLLTNSKGERQPLSLLLVGHHGSNTSTGKALLDVSQPRYAVHTNGWRNSYGHPHPRVVQDLRRTATVQYATGSHGAVWVSLQQDQVQIKYKNQRPPLWHWLSYKPY